STPQTYTLSLHDALPISATQEKRRKNAELRATRVETDTVEHKVPEADRICPKCNGTKLRPVGVGKESIVVDYVPGYFRRRRSTRSEEHTSELQSLAYLVC